MDFESDIETDCLIFIHIGKTAGTTFGQILARRIYTDRSFGAYDGMIDPSLRSSTGIFEPETVSSKITEAEARRNSHLRFFPGHMRFGLHTALRRPARYVTFLRDPVERVISAYNYVRSNGWLDSDAPLEEFVAADFLGNSDAMVRQLVHDSSLDAPTRPSLRKDARPVTLKDYNAAISNIAAHFHFAAPVSAFDDALVLLALKYQWPLGKLVYRRANVTRLKLPAGALTPRVHDMIVERNQWDIRLFAEASKQFDVLASAGHETSPEAFEKYELLLSGYSKVRSGRIWALSAREATTLTAEATRISLARSKRG